MIKLINRIYADFFMPSRLDEYEKILKKFIENDYMIYPIETFYRLCNDNKINPDEKYLIIRHDIDTDPKTARMIWNIERRLNIKSSYYFRLATLDIEFMKELFNNGCEVGYHFEELATYTKIKGIKTKEDILKELSHIRELFKYNVIRIKERSGLPINTVCSHGDFINSKIGISNSVIIEYDDLRKEMGIHFEVYDKIISNCFDSYISDYTYPRFWKTNHPFDTVNNKKILLLIHPRHWKANPIANIKNNIIRCFEGIKYRYF